MKSLLIMRHAKSSWSDSDLGDHDRPLNDRGKRDAPRMGRLLADERMTPDLIISSTAKRARKTVAKVAKASGFDGDIQFEAGLYHGDCETWLSLLRNVPERNDRVMVVGHNPGLEMLLELLTGRREELPTAALACLTLPIENWSQLPREPAGELAGIWRPRDLG